MNILIVDDKPANLLALRKLLEKPGLNIVEALSGNEALALILEHKFALILLDVQMPNMDGFETAELIRGNDETKHIPIIFVTAINKEQKYVFKGYDKGAVDYLFKPLDPYILHCKVDVFLELYGQKEGLMKTNKELKSANKRILEQQEVLIEEERLKVLLQMAGAKALELNQPLTSLLEDIDSMERVSDKPEKIPEYVNRIRESGRKISDISKKIKILHYSGPIPNYDSHSTIIFNREIKILVADNEEDIFKRTNDILEDIELINMFQVTSIKKAVALLERSQYDIIFLSHYLEDGTSIEFLDHRIEIPVIVITAHGSEMLASQVIQSGAYEYLPKSKINRESLSRAINNTLERARLRNDVRKAQAKMAEMSTVDELTKLHNRRYFVEVLEGEFERARRYETEMALIMMDLDHFKKTNDTYGHLAGDMVLSEIGKILQEHVRRNDLACRYGGEEFAVILPNISRDNIYAAYERFRKIVSEQPFKYESKQFHITVSIGIAFSKDVKTSNDLLVCADQALYQAKDRGRNTIVTFTTTTKSGI